MDLLAPLDPNALLTFNVILGSAMVVVVLVTRLGLGAAGRSVDFWLAGLLLLVLGRVAMPAWRHLGGAAALDELVSLLAFAPLFAGLALQSEAIWSLRRGGRRPLATAASTAGMALLGLAAACTHRPEAILSAFAAASLLLLGRSLRLSPMYWGGRLLSLASLVLLLFNVAEGAAHWRGTTGRIERHGLVLEMVWYLFSTAGFLQCVYQDVRDKLMAAVVTDSLTGALNRTGVLPLLRRDLDLALRGAEVSVALCDLDHFKAVNDTYGHATGDRVLQRFVARARAMLRGSDLVGRWGGEEFLLVLPGSSLAEAATVTQRIQRAIAELESDPRFTFSAGVANAREPCVGGDLDKLIAVADSRLYLAKRSRNCTVHEDGEGPREAASKSPIESPFCAEAEQLG